MHQAVLDERRLQLGRKLVEERNFVEGVVARVTHTGLNSADNVIPSLVVKLVKFRNRATWWGVFPSLLPGVPNRYIDPIHKLFNRLHCFSHLFLQNGVPMQRAETILD